VQRKHGLAGREKQAFVVNKVRPVRKRLGPNFFAVIRRYLVGYGVMVPNGLDDAEERNEWDG